MGKMGKKAGGALKKKTGVTIPPTKHRVIDEKKQGHLRSNRVTALLNMRKQKVKRDTNTGEIVKGSVLDQSDRIEKGKMARIAPNRGYFGAAKVIGQEAMQKFREEMGKKLKDPYSVLIKPAKLPLSLLEEPKVKDNLLEKKEFNFKGTFGKEARRKRVAQPSSNITELLAKANKLNEGYSNEKDRQLLENVTREADPLTMTAPIGRDMTIDRSGFDKGQSGRIWGQLWKVIDSSDVILLVLDARDPLGTRSKYIENYLQKEKKFKHVIFVLTKVDLIPTWATARWLQILSKDRPTVAFHGSLTNPFGKGNLINLLRQFSRLHGAVKGKKGGKKTISVGLIGYPNVGKSSIINTIRAKKVCKVAPIPGETKVWQYVNLSKSIFLIDCPGVIHDSDHKNNDVEAVLKGVVRVERMGEADKGEVIATILQIIKKEDLCKTYNIDDDWEGADEFLLKIATNRGKLLRGGVADTDAAARMVLHDWIRGRLPWFNAPPFDSNQQFRDHQNTDESLLLKKIQNYSTFNIINQELKSKTQQEEEGIAPASDSDSDDDELSSADEAEELPQNPDRPDYPSETDDEDEDGDEEAPKESKKQPAAKKRKIVKTDPKTAQNSKPAAPAISAWEALKAASKAAPAPGGAPATTGVPVKKVKLVKKK
eukprot:TRINITY_DN598_c0_g14_i1.p1 TRINITY_DN598_c0_g14~~TRINITY_DN598_c0_g14_i1.p1  ORF type:complete len:654 (+),score=245.27 TRINITY_DN598_c0_g14_i1:60-2021(+)